MTEQIERIYKEISNKMWSFGCKFYDKTDKYKNERYIINAIPHFSSSSENIVDWKIISPSIQTSDIRMWEFTYLQWSKVFNADMQWFQEEIFKNIYTIGHPVMIWCVMDYMESDLGIDFNYWSWEVLYKNIQFHWKKKRKPIESQSKECKDFVESLLPNNKE